MQPTTPITDEYVTNLLEAARHEAGVAQLSEIPVDILEPMMYRLNWVDPKAPTPARSDQLPPDDDDLTWFTWLQLGGRGSGKTRTGAEWTWDGAHKTPGGRTAVVAPTSADVRKTCFEGESGIIAKMPPSLLADYNRQEMRITLTNGHQIFGYSAQEPDRLRGPQHHRAWCDELAAWQYLDDALDNLLMGLRLGKTPRMIATTTPRPIKRLKEIIADPSTRVDRVSTYANKANLPAHFIKIILKRYEGTRLGRQELMAEIIDDVPGALWTRANLETNRILPDRETMKVVLPQWEELVVAVDPSITSTEDSDETGIVVAGRAIDKCGYVVEDLSMRGTPGEWAEAAVLAYDRHKAGRIVYEENQGGDMVAYTLRSAAAALKTRGLRDTDFVPLVGVRASVGKATRAEPISALYEQNRVKHVGVHAKLEDQMCEFTSDFDRKKIGYSPDRVDALVWALTRVMLSDQSQSGVLEFYRQEAEKVRAKLEGRSPALQTEALVKMIPRPGVNTASGKTGRHYVMTPDGFMHVEEEDVVPLLVAGFRRAD